MAPRTAEPERNDVEPTTTATATVESTATLTVAPTATEPPGTHTPPTQSAPTGGNSGGAPPAVEGNSGQTAQN